MCVIFTETQDKARRIRNILLRNNRVGSCVYYAQYLPVELAPNTPGHTMYTPALFVDNTAVGAIRRKVRKHRRILFAYTPDLVGDAMSWLLYYHLYQAFPLKTYQRLLLPAVSEDTVLSTFDTVRRPSPLGFEAYVAHRVVDRMVAFMLGNATRNALSYNAQISRLGCLVSAAIAEAECAPTTYYIIGTVNNEHQIVSRPYHTKAEAELVASRVSHIPHSIKQREGLLRRPPRPLNTADMLEYAIGIGLTAERTLDTCMILYNRGVITYPFTTCRSVSSSYAKQVTAFLQQQPDVDCMAHRFVGETGIHPTDPFYLPTTLSDQEVAGIYRGIWLRSILGAMADSTSTQQRAVWRYKSDIVFTAITENINIGGWRGLSAGIFDQRLPSQLAEEPYLTNLEVASKRHALGAVDIVRLLSNIGVHPSVHRWLIPMLVRTHIVKYEPGAHLVTTQLGRTLNLLVRTAAPDVCSTAYATEIEDRLGRIVTDSVSTAPMVIQHVSDALNCQRTDTPTVDVDLCPHCGRTTLVRIKNRTPYLVCRHCRKRYRTRVTMQGIHIRRT